MGGITFTDPYRVDLLAASPGLDPAAPQPLRITDHHWPVMIKCRDARY